MTRFRKSLGLLPFFFAFALCDNTLHEYFVMLIGGLVFWIPYWLAWWLSGGFNMSDFSGYYPEEEFPAPRNITSDFRCGPDGYGLYVGGKCSHH